MSLPLEANNLGRARPAGGRPCPCPGERGPRGRRAWLCPCTPASPRRGVSCWSPLHPPAPDSRRSRGRLRHALGTGARAETPALPCPIGRSRGTIRVRPCPPSRPEEPPEASHAAGAQREAAERPVGCVNGSRAVEAAARMSAGDLGPGVAGLAAPAERGARSGPGSWRLPAPSALGLWTRHRLRLHVTSPRQGLHPLFLSHRVPVGG